MQICVKYTHTHSLQIDSWRVENTIVLREQFLANVFFLTGQKGRDKKRGKGTMNGVIWTHNLFDLFYL